VADRSKLLFVVEDDANVLLMTSLILKRLGYEVRVFSTGEDALDALGVLLPRSVLCDFNLPGIDGLEVLKRVQQQAPEVDRVMVTGNTSAPEVQAGLDAGTVQVVLEKPFSIKSLCHSLYLVERGTTGRIFRYKH